ncbi:hypothetical protein BSKO_03681 [Bryopsis sp. KO-2023]|nr:hypothetical protein BSKO_03681 [Bryopsis sp. KO-2023]
MLLLGSASQASFRFLAEKKPFARFCSADSSINKLAPARGFPQSFSKPRRTSLACLSDSSCAAGALWSGVSHTSMLQVLPSLIVIAGAAFLVLWYGVLPNLNDDPDYELAELEGRQQVFISSKDLHDLMVNSSTGVTVLDARNRHNALAARVIPGAGDSIPGARRAPWGDFTVSGGRGDLKSVPELETIFRELGVSNDVPVVVYGSWKEEWGEEGRIFWQLQWLGHQNVRILHGGIFGWTESGLKGGSGFGGKGAFEANPDPDLIIDADEIAKMIDAGGDNLFLLDSRTESEFDGSLKYNVQRGGHIPGAVSFHWKEVFVGDGSGNLRDKDEVRQQLTDLGLKDGMKIAAYCTGGIRSGFFYAVFQWLGYSNIANYPGSWWDWASRTDLPVSTFAGHS